MESKKPPLFHQQYKLCVTLHSLGVRDTSNMHAHGWKVPPTSAVQVHFRQASCQENFKPKQGLQTTVHVQEPPFMGKKKAPFFFNN